ncbi:carbamoyl-phosphate synthase (glutamine-hydrolyzing) large subunit [Candidatus Woesearchaeota archaeon]|nr:carbamoyl-phosphate synthase (glutamine-hydrolyzing) large subunit [Candidatus Woesearchaeota archaeon]
MTKHTGFENINKVLILGSGALKIGEAGEFDYSGSQAIKALKEEGIKTVLVNPNIATWQTSEGMADKVYFLPVNPYFVEKVIKKEKPDGILLSFGGQTALNCGVSLDKKDVFKNNNVKVLGTPIKTIENTEDRALFARELKKVNIKTPKSYAASNITEAKKYAKKIGFPMIIRVAYALGGRGSGVAKNMNQFEKLAKEAFSFTSQILIEEYLGGWKEIEYEVVRDSANNCITVCNMENFDPMGIHTGESIVIAPSQTLTNSEYHKLREISIRLIRHLGIIGECNVQIALDTESEDYRVIEVNARLSRSSALASKATGYPLAFVAAKLSLGYSLTEIDNSITKKTKACFEPALDYIVVKIPRWDLQKFENVSVQIGSEMKSVGEVMAIGRKFEEALQKGIRMLNTGMTGISPDEIEFNDIKNELKNPTDKRVYAVGKAIKQGMSIKKIYDLSKIDPWFLYKIKNIIETEKEISKAKLNRNILLKAKKLGFSDEQIGNIKNKKEIEIRKLRKKLSIVPVIKQIDTLAAEFPAKTNYLYLTYNGKENDIEPYKEKSIIVLGSGAYKIGSSVEFDWCCVNAVLTAKNCRYKTIMINYNPETVSTDYDEVDKLFFDELSFERVMDIYEFENPEGIIISMGGQIPNNLALPLQKNKAKILGTSPESIDKAEDRNKFSKLLDDLGIDQPKWKSLTRYDDVKNFIKKVGYPVLIRPSYVLSGAAMKVVYNDQMLKEYISKASKVSRKYPVVISNFIQNAKEIEIDAVANKGEILVYCINEHVENAGVHSGDATMVIPPQRVFLETIRKIKKVAEKIAKELSITGPFNIQFIAKDNEIKVIECNLRSSRSFPFVSKVLKTNFIDLATKSILGKNPEVVKKPTLELDYVGVKAPQFSYSRLKGADPVQSVEMASTGEVACLGENVYDAYLKSMISTGFDLPKKNVLISISGDKNRYKLLETIRTLKKMGFKLYATEHTRQFYKRFKINATLLHKIHEKENKSSSVIEKFFDRMINGKKRKQPNVLNYLLGKKLDLVISIPRQDSKRKFDDNYVIRRKTIDLSIPLLTNVQITKLFVDSLENKNLDDLEIKSWVEYN